MVSVADRMAVLAVAKVRNIVLFGFMGTGKSTVGRILAQRLGMKFVDMDTVIEQRTGKSIPEIFAERGEYYFRRLERELVRELAGQEGSVIAAGGGVVLNPDNVADLGRHGLLVCLRARPETILRRVESESHRPLLERGDKAARIRQILEERRPLYDALPWQVDTDNLSPEEVAERVMAIYILGSSDSR